MKDIGLRVDTREKSKSARFLVHLLEGSYLAMLQLFLDGSPCSTVAFRNDIFHSCHLHDLVRITRRVQQWNESPDGALVLPSGCGNTCRQ